VNRQISVGDLKYGIFDDEFLSLDPISHKSPNFALQIISFFWSKHTVAIIIYARVLQTFFTTCVRGTKYLMLTKGHISPPKSAGVPILKFGTLYTATVDASNFKFGTELGVGE